MNRCIIGAALTVTASLSLTGCKDRSTADRPPCIITVPLDETDAAKRKPEGPTGSSAQGCDGQVPDDDERSKPEPESEGNSTGRVALA